MFKRKKAKKNLNNLGKEIYDFDFQLEKNIYCYLCCVHQKRKDKQKLDEKFKFHSYKKWKDYVYNKYKNFDNDLLIEFSRYLNQRIRDVKPIIQYWKLFVPVYLTLALTKIFELLFDNEFDFSGAPNLTIVIVLSVFADVFLILLIFLVWNTIIPIRDYNIEENLFIDYKEIIDNMIKK